MRCVKSAKLPIIVLSCLHSKLPIASCPVCIAQFCKCHVQKSATPIIVQSMSRTIVHCLLSAVTRLSTRRGRRVLLYCFQCKQQTVQTAPLRSDPFAAVSLSIVSIYILRKKENKQPALLAL